MSYLYKFRKKIIERDGYCCRYCDKKLTEKEVTIDHIVPVKHGGKDVIENLVVSCFVCNCTFLNDRLFDSFEDKREFIQRKINGLLSDKQEKTLEYLIRKGALKLFDYKNLTFRQASINIKLGLTQLRKQFYD